MDWVDPLYDADQMRALDRWAIDERRVPSLELMERAGAEVARVAESMTGDGPIVVVCGKGNNGGDGLVAARLLAASGHSVELLLLWPAAELSPDARECLQRLDSSVPVREVEPPAIEGSLDGSGLIVDAVLGTGFSGEPHDPVATAIEQINATPVPVLAVDVPSGVDASTGEASLAVRATRTVSFQEPKVGLWVNPGKSCAGNVEIVDIGIPGESRRPAAPSCGLISGSVLGCLPRRAPQGNKFRSGAVLVVGGSTGLTGAVCLASESAMRAGAGWVRAAVPASLNQIFEVKLTEVMTVPLPDDGGSLVDDGASQVLDAADRADAVAVGPGLGRDRHAFELAGVVVPQLARPLVLDADGLNAMAAIGLDLLSDRQYPTVLTPHSGEAARLLGVDSSDVEARRLACATELSERTRSIVVLKGDDTLVVDAESRRYAVSRGGSPALATAGTGDVLTGMVTALIARGVDPFDAACAAVFGHAEAGRRAAERQGEEGVIAGDVVLEIGPALRTGRNA